LGELTLDRVLIIGPLEPGSPFNKLASPLPDGSSPAAELLCPEGGRSPGVREAIDRSRIVVLAGDPARSRAVADDIWHLLRQKVVLSTDEMMTIDTLRSICPLSKVARGSFCIGGDVDRNLLLLSADGSLSGGDLQSLRSALSPLGEILTVNEPLLEAALSEARLASAAISRLLGELKESSSIDRDVCEYLLGWVLYGVGDAAIKGKRLDEALPPPGE
jgi:pyrroline-5-carboxylate reductase